MPSTCTVRPTKSMGDNLRCRCRPSTSNASSLSAASSANGLQLSPRTWCMRVGLNSDARGPPETRLRRPTASRVAPTPSRPHDRPWLGIPQKDMMLCLPRVSRNFAQRGCDTGMMRPTRVFWVSARTWSNRRSRSKSSQFSRARKPVKRRMVSMSATIPAPRASGAARPLQHKPRYAGVHLHIPSQTASQRLVATTSASAPRALSEISWRWRPRGCSTPPRPATTEPPRSDCA